MTSSFCRTLVNLPDMEPRSAFPLMAFSESWVTEARVARQYVSTSLVSVVLMQVSQSWLV